MGHAEKQFAYRAVLDVWAGGVGKQFAYYKVFEVWEILGSNLLIVMCLVFGRCWKVILLSQCGVSIVLGISWKAMC